VTEGHESPYSQASNCHYLERSMEGLDFLHPGITLQFLHHNRKNGWNRNLCTGSPVNTTSRFQKWQAPGHNGTNIFNMALSISKIIHFKNLTYLLSKRLKICTKKNNFSSCWYGCEAWSLREGHISHVWK